LNGKRYFKPLREAGSTTFRHDNTHESAQLVMDMLLEKIPMVLQIQEELSKPGATLEQTTAGSQISTDLGAIINKLEEKIKNMEKKMQEAVKAKDQAWQKSLIDELAKLKEDVKRATESKEQLRQRPATPPAPEPVPTSTDEHESYPLDLAPCLDSNYTPFPTAPVYDYQNAASSMPSHYSSAPNPVYSPHAGMPGEPQPNRSYLTAHGREEVSNNFGVEHPGQNPEVPSNSNSYTRDRGSMGFRLGRKQRNRETAPPSPSPAPQELSSCRLCGYMAPRHEMERWGGFCSERHKWQWEANPSRRY